jgi:hypothetical protein
MNIEKMKKVIDLLADVEIEDGVFGFDFHAKGFHVRPSAISNEPDLQLESRGSEAFPYEIFVQHEGFKVFAIITNEQIKDFPQFHEQTKADLLKQLSYLEEDVNLDGMEVM